MWKVSADGNQIIDPNGKIYNPGDVIQIAKGINIMVKTDYEAIEPGDLRKYVPDARSWNSVIVAALNIHGDDGLSIAYILAETITVGKKHITTLEWIDSEDNTHAIEGTITIEDGQDGQRGDDGRSVNSITSNTTTNNKIHKTTFTWTDNEDNIHEITGEIIVNDGADGQTGAAVESVEIETRQAGYKKTLATLHQTLTNGTELSSNEFELPYGEDGSDGEDGLGIEAIASTTTTENKTHITTMTYTDSEGQMHGIRGEIITNDGENGIDGNDGLSVVEIDSNTTDLGITHTTTMTYTDSNNEVHNISGEIVVKDGTNGTNGISITTINSETTSQDGEHTTTFTWTDSNGDTHTITGEITVRDGHDGDGSGDVLWAELQPKLDEKADKTEVTELETRTIGLINVKEDITQHNDDMMLLNAALENKQDKGDYALKSDIPDISSLATEQFVKSEDVKNLQAANKYTDDEISKIEVGSDSTFRTGEKVSDIGLILGEGETNNNLAGTKYVSDAIGNLANALGNYELRENHDDDIQELRNEIAEIGQGEATFKTGEKVSELSVAQSGSGEENPILITESRAWQLDNGILGQAKEYTDTEIAKIETPNLDNYYNKQQTDSLLIGKADRDDLDGFASETYVRQQTSQTLQQANNYTDEKISEIGGDSLWEKDFNTITPVGNVPIQIRSGSVDTTNGDNSFAITNVKFVKDEIANSGGGTSNFDTNLMNRQDLVDYKVNPTVSLVQNNTLVWKAHLNSQLEPKADKTYVDRQLNQLDTAKLTKGTLATINGQNIENGGNIEIQGKSKWIEQTNKTWFTNDTGKEMVLVLDNPNWNSFRISGNQSIMAGGNRSYWISGLNLGNETEVWGLNNNTTHLKFEEGFLKIYSTVSNITIASFAENAKIWFTTIDNLEQTIDENVEGLSMDAEIWGAEIE